MNELKNQDNLDNLVNTIAQIKHSSKDNEGLMQINSYINDLRTNINTVLEDGQIVCTDIFYTLNTDNEYFGVIINPVIDGPDAFKIFATSDPVVINKYQLEIDSKLLDTDLSPEEIAAVIIYEITSMLNPGQIDRVRSLIDLNVLNDNDVVHLRDSINYTQLIVYAIKDTLYKISSILFKEDVDDVLSNPWIQALDLADAIVSAQVSLTNNVFGVNDTLRSPQTVILQWVFMIYQDVSGYAATSIDTLKDAKSFTASKLLNAEIDKTITAIDRARSSIVKEDFGMPLHKFFESTHMYALNELGLFKALKADGLRKIEDDYYELVVQVKSIDTENDALYVLRSINSRLSILDDYIYNNTLKESDKKHWLAVARQYRDLRTTLVNKKISKRKYSDIFMDYNDFESDND